MVPSIREEEREGGVREKRKEKQEEKEGGEWEQVRDTEKEKEKYEAGAIALLPENGGKGAA